MWPEHFPVIAVNDIIPPPPEEYEDDKGRKSTVGWLKSILLYDYDGDPNYMWISQESRKNYEKALDIARKECKIGKTDSLESWEETASRKKQAAVLNAVRKKLGYTQETYVEY